MLAPLSAARFAASIRGRPDRARANRQAPHYACPMRRAALVIGLLAGLAGLVFSLQGAGILPGSYMTGDRFWLFVGLLMLVGGAGLVAWSRRMPAS